MRYNMPWRENDCPLTTTLRFHRHRPYWWQIWVPKPWIPWGPLTRSSAFRLCYDSSWGCKCSYVQEKIISGFAVPMLPSSPWYLAWPSDMSSMSPGNKDETSHCSWMLGGITWPPSICWDLFGPHFSLYCFPSILNKGPSRMNVRVLGTW